MRTELSSFESGEDASFSHMLLLKPETADERRHTCLPKKSRVIRLIAAFTALRNAVVLTFGLGTDDAHYVLYAKFLDLSYFDYPPLVGWIQALSFSSSSSTIIFIGHVTTR